MACCDLAALDDEAGGQLEALAGLGLPAALSKCIRGGPKTEGYPESILRVLRALSFSASLFAEMRPQADRKLALSISSLSSPEMSRENVPLSVSSLARKLWQPFVSVAHIAADVTPNAHYAAG